MIFCAYLNIIEIRLFTIMKSSRLYIVFSPLYSKIPKGVILHRVKTKCSIRLYFMQNEAALYLGLHLLLRLNIFRYLFTL